jgi:polyisoprenoid-binding protein YceI
MAGSFAACNNTAEETAQNNAESTGDSTVNVTNDTSLADVQGEAYTVNTSNSVVLWEGKKPGKDHNGTVKLSEGKVIVNNGQVSGGRFIINFTSIENTDLKAKGDMDSYNKLVGHLKSPDFFDVEKFPSGTFVITKVTPKDGPDGANAEVTGNLTVKGKTNPITFPAKITINGNQLMADAKFKLDRSKYDIRYGSKTFFPDKAVNDLIDNDVDMEVKLVAGK